MSYKYISMAAVALALSMAACSDETEALSGQGTAKLAPSISTDVAVTESRSSDADLRADLADSFILWISNSKGVVRAYNGLDNVPDEISLLSGSYLAEAWAGDSVSASWDKRWFKGAEQFQISNGVVTPVNIKCSIANVVVSVEYDPSVNDVLQDYTLTVGHSRGSLVFDDEHLADKAYFMMPSADKDLAWTLTGKEKADGATIFTRTSIIEAVQPGHHYIFKVSCAAQEGDELGGGFLNIVIDDTTIDQAENVEIAVAPVITGYHFNMDKPLYATPGTVGRRSFYVSATSALKSAIVECKAFQTVFGEGKVDFDAMTMDDEARAQLLAAGVKTTYVYDEEADASTLKITFEEEFTNTLTEDGNYDFKFTATDAADKTSSKTWTVAISAEPYTPDPIVIETPAADSPDIWTDKATISGTIVNADAIDASTLKVMYAPAGLSRAGWQEAITTLNGDVFTVEFTDLNPGTEYQYYATAETLEGETFETELATFTTESAAQLPNASFEDWQDSSAPFLIYGSGQSMFWDSGNHGSATMSKNVTVPNTSTVHSGSRSIELASQFVGFLSIGKFAAGNVFVGEYLTTNGTNGVLGWGRPFTSRPKALKGWVKYDPVKVSHSDNTSLYPKDVMDNGIIYVALMDDNLYSYSKDGKTWNYPVIVNTANPETELFDRNSDKYKPHVIAYGEIVWKEATGGLIEFEVPIEYYDLTRRPSYIVITASASKGGDYFAGGNGSKMILDDLELVY